MKYRILSGAEGKFEIDESTGLIVTVDYLDYETKTSYLMNVSATDQAPPFNQGFCTVYITLLNELDEAVQFSNASYEVAILENLALGTEIDQFFGWGGLGWGEVCVFLSLLSLPPSARKAHKLLLADIWARLASCKAVITRN